MQNTSASQQNSLFGEMQGGVDLREPSSFGSDEWSLLEKLKKEKEVTGIYISGHPLDDYRLEIQTFTNSALNEIEKVKTKSLNWLVLLLQLKLNFLKTETSIAGSPSKILAALITLHYLVKIT